MVSQVGDKRDYNPVVPGMSKSDVGLIIFASLLIVAITVSYLLNTTRNQVGDTLFRQPGDPSFPSVVRLQNDNYESWRKPKLPDYLKNADQTDRELIEHIRQVWILPAPSSSGRRLSHPEKYDHSEFGQSFVVDKLLKGLDKGFYVDSWAGNGETHSNSLFLEKDRHWHGILIEPNPINFLKLIGKRRQAFLLNGCISPTTTPAILTLTFGGEDKVDEKEHTVKVQCFPLFSILAALKVNTVDYLSLKTEGLESDILKTLPLEDKIKVHVLSIETYVYKNRGASQTNSKTVRKILSQYGYEWVDAGDRINRRDVIMLKRSNKTVSELPS